MYCPEGCLKLEKYKVYGTGHYTYDSSICRAAIHDGKITDEGGKIFN